MGYAKTGTEFSVSNGYRTVTGTGRQVWIRYETDKYKKVNAYLYVEGQWRFFIGFLISNNFREEIGKARFDIENKADYMKLADYLLTHGLEEAVQKISKIEV